LCSPPKFLSTLYVYQGEVTASILQMCSSHQTKKGKSASMTLLI